MNKVLIFVLGAAAGSLVTWKIVEEKYKKIANDEIESVIEHFNNKNNEAEEKVIIEMPKEIEKESIVELVEKENEKLIKDLGYADEDNDEDCIVETPPVREYIPPYVISPEEFGEYGNEMKSLTYYEDGVLTDEDDEIISDPESIIGDALQHFGEYEDDAVHVRDESIECDYEILKSEKTFSEVYKEEN